MILYNHRIIWLYRVLPYNMYLHMDNTYYELRGY